MPCWGWALAGAAGSSLLAALWARRSVAIPLSALQEVAARLARGEHGARAATSPATGLGRLGATLNLLAERFEHDISELRRLEQVRKDFVANVSHELKTPLSAIKAFAETLRSGALDDERHRSDFVLEIERNAERMTSLVDDLLALSALESGRMPPNFEPLSLTGVTAEVAASLIPLAQRKGIVLRVEPLHGVPQVRADRGQLKQVLTNLLDNAIKFTGEGGTVVLSADASEGRVTVQVRDSGVGIPEEDLPRVFERFYRVDKARAREAGGTGLGLSIVKHIVEGHGGSVSVESSPGRGSTFRFTLPALA